MRVKGRTPSSGLLLKALRRRSSWSEQGRCSPRSLQPSEKARHRGRAGHPGSAPDGPLDVHRRCREPQLDLDAASSPETRPPQPVQFFRQAEGAFYMGLPLDEPPFAQRARDTFLSGLHQVEGPRAVQRTIDPGGSALRAERAGRTAAFGRLIAHVLRPLQVWSAAADARRRDRGRHPRQATTGSARAPRCPCAGCRSGWWE